MYNNIGIDNLGDFYKLKKGVMQGGVLSPFIYAFYIADLLNLLQNNS